MKRREPCASGQQRSWLGVEGGCVHIVLPNASFEDIQIHLMTDTEADWEHRLLLNMILRAFCLSELQGVLL